MDHGNEGTPLNQEESAPTPEKTLLSADDDIPEAQRDTPPMSPSAAKKLGLWMGTGIGAIALLGGMTFAVVSSESTTSNASPQSLPTIAPSLTALLGAYLGPSAAGVDQKRPTLLGHRAFNDAPSEDLVAVTADGRIKMRTAAAASFERMATAARGDGVSLVPLSAFRSQADQNYLFFGIQEQRGQGPQTRAEVSAPPGYSEHHTGYAVDIGDATRPDTNVIPEFENTDAFRWLKDNAAHYGFELSFPPDNEQGVSYEPWHWRFVGDRDSLETFYQE